MALLGVLKWYYGVIRGFLARALTGVLRGFGQDSTRA